jgi:predicted esterase
MNRPALLPFAFALSLLAACGSDSSSSSSSPSGGQAEVTALFRVPARATDLAGEHFFDHPFPSDLRRDADGAAIFEGWPNPSLVPLIDTYVKSLKGLLHGFSPASAAYLRFSGPLDPATLPADPPATTANDAAVQIVDVDPTSPERGKRKLAMIHWQEEQGVYWPPNTLAVLPMLGQPLRPKTRYAVVVTNKAKAKGGGKLAPSHELAQALGAEPATDQTRAAHDLFAPAVAALESAAIPAKDIVHMTVFTTDDPTEEMFAVFDDVAKSTPAPTARDWKKTDDAAGYSIYEGTYGPSPNYQAGTPPFGKPKDGGAFVFENGKPKVQSTFDLRFALAVPDAQKCPMPEAGYPIVLYAHGTGGDYRSFVNDGTAASLAGQCLATMGIDQIFHGTRPGAPPESDPQHDQTIQLLFFNFDNPIAARTSNRQSAADVVQQARLFTESRVKVPAAVSKTGGEIAFDGSRLTFFGHSQGGLNGPLFLAGSTLARGGVLSGAGSVLAIALLEKTKPVDVAAAMRLLVGLSNPEEAKELNVFHPAMTLVQSIVDTADPLHYGPFITRTPRDGAAPKSIFQTEGVAPDGRGDSYAPPHGIEALSVSIGLPRVAPGVKPIAEAGWASLSDVSVPAEGLSGNLAGGRASGVLAQFVPQGGKDGHFVVFNDPKARLQAAVFLKNLAADPKGRVPSAGP